jgi:arylsulfatase A-like enzyme
MMANKRSHAATVGLLSTALLLLSTVSSVRGEHSPPATAPKARHENTNVILISLQCLRADHLGAYGYKRNTSANIDQLAGKSVLFENAISQANLTPVAQMSVLTSQYPRVNGMVSFEVTKDMVTARTLPEILKYYGYTTAATISSPEFFMRFDTTGGELINPGDVFSRSFDYYGRTARGPEGASLRVAPVDAFNWLKNNSDKKFFLWIGSGLLHMPYSAAVPAPYKTMYDPPGYTPFWKRLPQLQGRGDDSPSYDIFSRVYKNDFYWDFKPVYHLTEEDNQYITARYDAGVYYTDLFIGNLMKLLDSLKLTEKTLIVLQSMHGDDLGENGLYFHYDVTDPVIKNALMFRFPQAEYGGRRVNEQISNLDVMPTILNYLEIPPPNEAQGESLLPLIRGEKGAVGSKQVFIDRLPWWEYTLSRWYLDMQSATGKEFTPAETEKLTGYQKDLKDNFSRLGYPPGDIAIRTLEWKLILRKNSALLDTLSWWGFITGLPQHNTEVELYDLKNDPQEKFNVAEKRPEIVARLKKSLLEWDSSVENRKMKYAPVNKRIIIPYP